jgi:centrin-3
MGTQFGLFDMDKDGFLDFHELKVALRALGFDVPKGEISQILVQHGVHDNSASTSKQAIRAAPNTNRYLISHAEFQKVAALRIAARDPAEEINKAFDMFDSNGKGGINVEDLRRVARELNEGLQEAELQAMIEEFDLDGDGVISREEFLSICLG